jgi:outer membrane protein OmpA-like peptidoglycan-associated protein
MAYEIWHMVNSGVTFKNLLAAQTGAALLLLPLCWASAQENGKVLDQGAGKVLDLVFRVEEIGAKTQDLQVKESAAEVRIELAADVLFDFDKAEILPKAQSALKQAAGLIRDKARGAVRVEGHTDAKGSDAYNQKLSERRALAVKAWLNDKEGLRNAQFLTQGFGARKPKASNKKPDGADDPEGRQQNRRVEIIFKK